MFACRKARGLISAALYETPPPDESAWLEAHLHRCAKCREEAAALRLFTARLPVTPVPFSGDVLPALRERLREAAPQRSFPARRAFVQRYAAVAALLAVAAVTAQYAVRNMPPAATAPVEVLATPLERMLAEARSLGERDFNGALRLLESALDTYSTDARAGEAQQLLAQLEFNHGQRYAQAYEAYGRLRKHYPETWKADPQNIRIFNLLDEARVRDFEPLYQLDAARNAASNPVNELEIVVSKYPGSLVAGQAVEAMAATLQEDTRDTGPAARVAALEAVRRRCTLPGAVAQVTLALADTCRDGLNDAAQARPYYDAVAQCGDPVLAPIAKQALARLDAPSAP